MNQDRAGHRAGSAAGHCTGSLPQSDRIKLARIMGMLGSDHPGERDADGLAAVRLVRQHNASWLDVLTPASSAAPHPSPADTGLAVAVATSRGLAAFMNAWEQQFVDSVARLAHLSAKQRRKLEMIAEDLPRRAAA